MVGLSLVAIFLGWLALAAIAVNFYPRFASLDATSRGVWTTLFIIVFAAASIIPPLGFKRFVPRGWMRWLYLATVSAPAVLWVPAISVISDVLHDDPLVHGSPSIEEISPALPGDEISYAVLLRYAKHSPAADAFAPPVFVIKSTEDLSKNPEAWAQFTREHRAEIEAGWAALAPVRAWFDELNRFDRIGDLGRPEPRSPIMDFKPVRAYTRYAVAIASLRALDGQGDEAMAIIGTLYDVARKWEPTSRSIVNLFIAKVGQQAAINAANFVLDHATVSAASRTALTASLQLAEHGPAGARRVVMIDCPFARANFGPQLRSAKKTLPFAQAILADLNYKPRATENLIIDRFERLASLAEARRLEKFKATEDKISDDHNDPLLMNNFLGHAFAKAMLPALLKPVTTYWEIEDLRAALLHRLQPSAQVVPDSARLKK